MADIIYLSIIIVAICNVYKKAPVPNIFPRIAFHAIDVELENSMNCFFVCPQFTIMKLKNGKTYSQSMLPIFVILNISIEIVLGSN